MTKPRKTLPQKPSELIRLALRDLSLIEKDPHYEINMSVFHSYYGGTCAVCFAGAVMAKTLGSNFHYRVAPHDFNSKTANALRALDAFRVGDIELGLIYLRKELPKTMRDTYAVPEYEYSPVRFRRALVRLADRFERNGL